MTRSRRFKLPFNGLPNEVRPVLVLTQNGLDPVKCPSGNRACMSSAHLFLRPIDYFSYEVLTYLV
jgi:hypothetical protein